MSRHNLSFDRADISLDLLIEVAAAAVNNARLNLDRYMLKCDLATQDYPNNTDDGILIRTHIMATQSKHAAAAAKDWAEALDTYHVLLEAKKRKSVVIEK